MGENIFATEKEKELIVSNLLDGGEWGMFKLYQCVFGISHPSIGGHPFVARLQFFAMLEKLLVNKNMSIDCEEDKAPSYGNVEDALKKVTYKELQDIVDKIKGDVKETDAILPRATRDDVPF